MSVYDEIADLYEIDEVWKPKRRKPKINRERLWRLAQARSKRFSQFLHSHIWAKCNALNGWLYLADQKIEAMAHCMAYPGEQVWKFSFE